MTGAKVPVERAIELERQATDGAAARGSSARARDIADAIRFVVGRERGGPAEFFRRTGVRVTADELRAIVGLPAKALVGGMTPEQKNAAKRELAAAGKARRSRFEARWARGRSASPQSVSVRTASGGLPGQGRRG